jgi:hypothetical protein
LKVSDGNYFGEDIKVAVLRTEFDKDVYLVDDLVCPRPFGWKPEKVKDDDCLPCNYASKNKRICGTSLRKNGKSSSKCKCDEDKIRLFCGSPTKKEWIEKAGVHVESRSDFAKKKSHQVKFNNSTNFGITFPSPDDWSELEADVQITGRYAETGKSHYYRYYHSDPEVGFRVEIRTQYGSTNMFVIPLLLALALAHPPSSFTGFYQRQHLFPLALTGTSSLLLRLDQQIKSCVPTSRFGSWEHGSLASRPQFRQNMTY